MIDVYLLRLGGVYYEWIRPKDFASDNLVNALISFRGIEKVKARDIYWGVNEITLRERFVL